MYPFRYGPNYLVAFLKRRSTFLARLVIDLLLTVWALPVGRSKIKWAWLNSKLFFNYTKTPLQLRDSHFVCGMK